MYRITNIVLSRKSHALYHLPDGMSPASNPFGYEPWIAGMQLKLGEDRILTKDQYEASKVTLATLIGDGIVEIECLTQPEPEQVPEAPAKKEDVQVFEIGVPIEQPEPPVVHEEVVAEPLPEVPPVPEEEPVAAWTPATSDVKPDLPTAKKKKNGNR